MVKKRIVSIVVVVLLFSTLMLNVFAYVPNTTNKLQLTSVQYGLILNVYTSGNPASGNNVTLYTPNSDSTGNASQSWKNVEISAANGQYRLACYYNTALTLNYNQATSKCTVYTVANNYYKDYIISYLDSTNGSNIIRLAHRDLYLGNSGNYNGAQCYWYSYTENMTVPEQNKWNITTWMY